MTIKLLILKTGEQLISDVKEGIYQEKLVCYILTDPYSVSIKGTYVINGDTQTSISLNRWPILSKDNIIEITPDSLITISDPILHLKDLYTQTLEHERNSNNSINESSSTDKSD